MKRECCKNCVYLMFYDEYFCGLKAQQDEDEIYLNDIELNKCGSFELRDNKFWFNEKE